MTLDERLERLTERHEALTQTVGLIAGMHKQTESVLIALAEAQVRTEKGLGDVQDAIRRLARIAESHEQRLSDLEGE